MKKILLSIYLIVFCFTISAQLTFITDPNPSLTTQSSNPDGYIKFGNYVYFAASDGIRDNVYRTDGTSSGTEVCIPGVYFAKATVVNNKLYFLGIQQDTISGLFVSDGTPAGTQCLYRSRIDSKSLLAGGADIYFSITQNSISQLCSYNTDQNTTKVYPPLRIFTGSTTSFFYKNDMYFFGDVTGTDCLLLRVNKSETKLDTVFYTPTTFSFKPYHVIYNDSIRVFYRKNSSIWLTSTVGTKATNKTSVLIGDADMSSAPVLYNDSITFIGTGYNGNLEIFKVKPFSGYKRTKILNYGSSFEYKNCLIDGKLLFLPCSGVNDIIVCSNSSVITGRIDKSPNIPFYLTLNHLGKNGDYDYFVYADLIIKVNLNTANGEVIDNKMLISESAQFNGYTFYTKDGNFDREPWYFNYSNLKQEKLLDINALKETTNIKSFTNFNNAYYFNSRKLTENLAWLPSVNKLSKDGSFSVLWESNKNSSINPIGVFNNKLFFGTDGKIIYTDNTKVDTIKGVSGVNMFTFNNPSIATNKIFFIGNGTNETNLSLFTIDQNLALNKGVKIDYNNTFAATSSKAFYVKDSVPVNSNNRVYYLVSTDGTPNNRTYIKAFDHIRSLHALPSWSNVLLEAYSPQSNNYSYYFNDGTPDKMELIGNLKGYSTNEPILLKKQYILSILNGDSITYLLTGGTVAGSMFLRDHALKAYSEINDNLFLSLFSHKTKKNSLVYKPATSNKYTTIKNFNDSVITSMCSTADYLYFLVKLSENTYDLWRMNGTNFNLRKMETLNLGDKVLPKLMAIEGTKAFLLCTNAEYGDALYYYTFTQPTNIGEKEVSAAIKIGPNPVENYITIESPVAIRNIEISDIAGRMVDQIKNINATQYDVIFSNRKAGVYFVKIELNDGSKMTKKIIKN